MSRYRARAEELRNDRQVHYNCAQAVLIPFAEAAGMTAAQANAVSANFGSGMKMGSVCGAVTGGLMALGLFGVTGPDVIGKYCRSLREAHCGCLDCADLLRMNAEAGRDKKSHCDDMVYECVGMVEQILREKELLRE